ncbi:MAG: nicotinic acid mononucleotide adenylyltransferase [Candidatus Omnitrophica bacterium CG07_land_8_20_14_0_80_42_15]|uniref:Probable nicotinate-nucleotide adenylyltransferase n=1 Tax=Candidatus Aquitaenariimonas noxiae TaxID=1974741 RepID=A0A2J0KT07_9BACT|nr:MAG: nicotinic acid mononucleotide adenylyltransferase [Candidatus Omnitrophica bacterium CG07_land_8_20_14_0_80_42_15]
MRIGILGGTFDPIHIAHMRLAEVAKEKLRLDKIIFVPAYMPPHKNRKDIAAPDLRYEMVKLAIEGKDGFEASDIEINKKNTSYSVETLRALKEKFGPETELFFITGSDSLSELPNWKNIGEIFKLAHFVVANRPKFPLKNVPQGAEVLKIPDMDISSSDLRNRIKEGKRVEDMIPQKVISYINEKSLYS